MFESDDFDQVLSQLDYTETIPDAKSLVQQPAQSINIIKHHVNSINHTPVKNQNNTVLKPCLTNQNSSNLPQQQRVGESQFEDYDKIEIIKEDKVEESISNGSHKLAKKRLIGSLFDHQSKRKFPGPAGLLLHSRSHCNDENFSHLEISSQDVDLSQEHLHPSVFDLTLWKTLKNDISLWGIDRLDSISCIKQNEMSGRLPSRKAHALIAFVEAVDRSIDNPLIILRDNSGTIKCTLHRDAWAEFASCIMSEYAAIALWKPTVLTTGTTYKKHYLNITLSNIIAVYCSNNTTQGEKPIPNGYSNTVFQDFVAIKRDNCDFVIRDSVDDSNTAKGTVCFESSNLLDGLDSVSFLDEDF